MDIAELQRLLPHNSLRRASELPSRAVTWTLKALCGSLVQLSWGGHSAAYALAAELVTETQQAHQFCAWIRPAASGVHPPDLYRWGIDPAALPFVMLDEPLARLQATETLACSGAFSTLIVECDQHLAVAPAKRLADSAKRHQVVIVLLTPQKDSGSGPGWRLAHVQVRTERQALPNGRFCIQVCDADRPESPIHTVTVHGSTGLH